MLESVQGQDAESNRSKDAENRSTSILVVDDHPVLRLGVSMLLAAESGLTVLGEASSCTQARDMLLRLQPDVIVMDLMLEDGNACGLIRKIQAEGISGATVVYTAHAGKAQVLEALRSGASGYVVKGSTQGQLIDAVHTVACGGSYLDPAITSQVMGGVGRVQEGRSPHSRDFTAREATVLCALALGKRNKEIALELHITERTVKYHVKRLFTKLRVKNRMQAVRTAIEQGLISL